MNEAPIQAVELVRSIRDEMYEEIKGLSAEELKLFLAREAGRSTTARQPLEPVADRPAA
jgi:hypothetical protein